MNLDSGCRRMENLRKLKLHLVGEGRRSHQADFRFTAAGAKAARRLLARVTSSCNAAVDVYLFDISKAVGADHLMVQARKAAFAIPAVPAPPAALSTFGANFASSLLYDSSQFPFICCLSGLHFPSIAASRLLSNEWLSFSDATIQSADCRVRRIQILSGCGRPARCCHSTGF